MDRITNESNLWLRALKLEDEGNYLEAFEIYLQDSKLSFKKKSFVGAALSCSCAATCLVKTGNIPAARKLYHQAGQIYENNGDHVIGDSVREAMWSYQEACDYFTLACENVHVQNVCEKLIALARKVNPFFGEQEIMESLRLRKLEIDANNISKTNMKISADVDREINNFLHEIKENLINLTLDGKNSTGKVKHRGEISEESITN